MSDATDKLARTRLAIIEHVYRKEMRRDKRAFAAAGNENREQEPREGGPGAGIREGGGRMGRVRRAAKSYWRHHPARMGVQMAAPLLARYARKHPLAYLGIAAAAGALLMAARPWRLISVTGVLVALAKSPQIAGLVMSAMSGSEFDEDEAEM